MTATSSGKTARGHEYGTYSIEGEWCNRDLLKNRLAVKKGAALFKMASVKKVVKSKGAAKRWL